MDHSDKLQIKGMVCNRCIDSIRDLLTRSGYTVKNISLGKVLFGTALNTTEKEAVRAHLGTLGFDVIEDRQEKLIREIKKSIDELIDLNGHGERTIRLSAYLSDKFNKSYDALGELFSQSEGLTLEKFYISRRIEKVKELLVYTGLSLSEIAFKTGFSSPHHLSNQFKSYTGQNPSEFRQIGMDRFELNRRAS